MHNYYNYYYFLLANLEKFNISLEDVILLQLIRYYSETNQTIDFAVFAKKLNIDTIEVGNRIFELREKKLLGMKSVNGQVNYDTNIIYSLEIETTAIDSIFSKFEAVFSRVFSQKEMDKIKQLINDYDPHLIEYALRESAIRQKVSLPYIEKILMNWKAEGITVEIYEQRYSNS